MTDKPAATEIIRPRLHKRLLALLDERSRIVVRGGSENDVVIVIEIKERGQP